MTMEKMHRGLAGMAIVCLAAISTPGAQTPPPKDMAELLAALKDPGLTERQKQSFVKTVFSGVVEVREVQEVPRTPTRERPFDSLPSDKPARESWSTWVRAMRTGTCSRFKRPISTGRQS